MSKVVTIGGGTGTPIINEALLLSGIGSITSIAAVFDSGGATGRRRLDSMGREIAYSDAMRILLSLIDPKEKTQNVEVVKKWFNHRDDRGKVLGQDIFNRFFDDRDGFSQIEKDMQSLGIKFKGKVIPASTSPANLIFKTISGRIFEGENLLDEYRMSKDMVEKIWLNPKVKACRASLQALKEAKTIIISCGSFYGSILSNFLPSGMKSTFKSSPAKKILITNLVTTRNETYNFTPLKLVKVFKKYAGIFPDILIVPNISRKQFEGKHKDISNFYDLENSHFLGWEDKDLEKLQKLGIKILKHNAIEIVDVEKTNQKILRHNPKKLAKTLLAAIK